jgi:predicted branched-subunit amino acid permease
MIPTEAFLLIPIALILILVYLVIGLLQKTKMKPSTLTGIGILLLFSPLFYVGVVVIGFIFLTEYNRGKRETRFHEKLMSQSRRDVNGL